MKPNPTHSTTKDVKEMTDAELAEELAKGMKWRIVKKENPNFIVKYIESPDRQYGGDSWNPCQDYNHCRIVELNQETEG